MWCSCNSSRMPIETGGDFKPKATLALRLRINFWHGFNTLFTFLIRKPFQSLNFSNFHSSEQMKHLYFEDEVG